MGLITVIDAMGANIDHITIPPGVKTAAYVTGSGPVPWSPAQLAAHPDAIRIDQSPVNTPADETADIIDMEQDAATLNDLRDWCPGALHNFETAARPGQRSPLVYMSQANVTPVANVLTANGLTHGIGLWLACEMTAQQAAHLVLTASGPFPIRGVQYAFLPDHDISVFDAEWWANVSGKPKAPAPRPGVQDGWRYCHKCSGLFYSQVTPPPVCPVGGLHDGSQSHDYTLSYDR
jgi:hypothetical protein